MRAEPEKPKLYDNLRRSKEWSMVSNAALRSREKSRVALPCTVSQAHEVHALICQSLTFCSTAQRFIWFSCFSYLGTKNMEYSLPPHILQSQTLSSFRRHLKTHYFQSAYCAPFIFWDFGAIYIAYLLTYLIDEGNEKHCVFMSVIRMFCALTDNGTHWPLCGFGRTELSICIRQEIPGLRGFPGTTSAGTWRHTLGMSAVSDDAAATSRLLSEVDSVMHCHSSNAQVTFYCQSSNVIAGGYVIRFSAAYLAPLCDVNTPLFQNSWLTYFGKK